ncbi:MAG: hypothetical protein ACOYVK_03460 [Bacillota bacterium]
MSIEYYDIKDGDRTALEQPALSVEEVIFSMEVVRRRFEVT